MATFFAEEKDTLKMKVALQMPELWTRVRRDKIIDDMLMFEWASKARNGDSGYADVYTAALALGCREPHTTSVQPIYHTEIQNTQQ